MRDFGKIISLEGERAQVAIQPHNGCASCGMKNSCKPGETTQLLWALNPKAGEVGDEVVVELKPRAKLFGSALVFIFPLIGLFLGYYIGNAWGGNDDSAVLGSIMGLTVFFVVVRIIDKLIAAKQGFKPLIIQVLH